MYSVKQLSTLAGVSPRTLHFYDQIGLLRPTKIEDNGYRRYGEQALYRLQQILFYKELGFSLEKIKEILSRPDFHLLSALEQHRQALRSRQDRLDHLIETVDRTINQLKGRTTMNEKKMFESFSEEKQKEYQAEAAQRWPEAYKESSRRWNSYSSADKLRIGEEGESVYRDLVAALDQDPGSEKVQKIVGRWHQHLRYFYEPTVEVLRGLGRMYLEDPRFAATFERMHPQLAEFHHQAIEIYCDRLESAGQ